MGGVIISPNPVKTKERIDFNGNVIDPKTKQIIVPNIPDAPPPQTPQPPPSPVIAPTTYANPQAGALSILAQIDEAKKNLANLEELKRLKIEEKKKELELLQQ